MKKWIVSNSKMPVLSLNSVAMNSVEMNNDS